MKDLPISRPIDLHFAKWVFVHEEVDYSTAQKVYNCMYDSAQTLNINVDEPYWITLKQEKDTESFKKYL